MAATEPAGRGPVIGLIQQILDRAPYRPPTSEGEKVAQQMIEERFAALGLKTEWHRFRFNRSLYQNLALHFGIGTLATLIALRLPWAALALHLLAAVSYFADSTRRFYLLRRVLGFRPSQNLLGTAPARGEPALRVVLAAHADAAFTGVMFWPRVCRLVARRALPGYLGRSLSLATATLFLLAASDLARLLLGGLPEWWRLVEYVLAFPPGVTFLLSMDVVIRHQVVPGANDDLSGVAALPALAERLLPDKPEQVELVFAVTGCEEASMGGADALARDYLNRWSRDNTVFLALDGLTNGALRYMVDEGEVVARPVPPWLLEIFADVAAETPDLGPTGFRAPVGGTDCAVFLARGYPAGALVCVDDAFGTPRNYHQHVDTAEGLDPVQLERSIVYTERLVRAIIAARLEVAASDKAASSVPPAR